MTKERKFGLGLYLTLIGIFVILLGALMSRVSIEAGLLIILGGLVLNPSTGGFISNRLKPMQKPWIKFPLVIALIYLGFFIYPTPTPSTTHSTPITQSPSRPIATNPPKEYISTSFLEFNDLFGLEGSLTDVQKDAMFDSRYKGKYVRWTCELVDLREGTFSDKYRMSMKCNPEAFTFDLTVTLRDDQKNKAILLSKGSQVRFEARLTDFGTLLGHDADDGIIIG